MKKLYSALLASAMVLGFTGALLAQSLPPTPQPDAGARVTANKPASKTAKKAKGGKKSQRKKHAKKRHSASRVQ